MCAIKPEPSVYSEQTLPPCHELEIVGAALLTRQTLPPLGTGAVGQGEDNSEAEIGPEVVSARVYHVVATLLAPPFLLRMRAQTVSKRLL